MFVEASNRLDPIHFHV